MMHIYSKASLDQFNNFIVAQAFGDRVADPWSARRVAAEDQFPAFLFCEKANVPDIGFGAAHTAAGDTDLDLGRGWYREGDSLDPGCQLFAVAGTIPAALLTWAGLNGCDPTGYRTVCQGLQRFGDNIELLPVDSGNAQTPGGGELDPVDMMVSQNVCKQFELLYVEGLDPKTGNEQKCRVVHNVC